ncbi:MAG: recombinase family protein [Pyrinomonadaceae bacterium]
MTKKKSQHTLSDQPMALVYCRVSTRHQEEEGSSLESQAEACIQHAKSLGYAVGRVTKEAYSGAELFDRPLLGRDRADIRAGAFQAIIVYAVDRLSRNVAHLAILSEECDRSGCQLLFVTEQLDNTPEGKLMQSVKGYVAEVERLKIRERTMRGRKTKLQQGRPIFNGWDLYGYRGDREAGLYRICEPEAAVVRRIYSMSATGYGMHSIASTLNNENIPSPKVDARPGAKWTASTVSFILKCRSYKGEEFRLRTKRTARKRDLPQPESEWIRLPDGVRPPIVPPELWAACQHAIKTNAGEMKRNGDRPVLLRGHAFCGECGSRMIRNRFKRGRYEYDKYRCGSRWRPFKTTCSGRGVSLALLDEWVWDNVKSILLDPKIIEREVERLQGSGPDESLANDLEAARSSRGRTERGLQALIKKFRNSADDVNLWPYIKREIDQASREKQQLEEAISQLESRIADQARHVADLRYLSDYCERVRENLATFTFDDKRCALQALDVKVYANGDDSGLWQWEVSIPLEEQSDVIPLHILRSARL